MSEWGGTDGAFASIGSFAAQALVPVASNLLDRVVNKPKKTSGGSKTTTAPAAAPVQAVAPQAPSPVAQGAGGGVPSWAWAVGGGVALLALLGVGVAVFRR